MSDFFPGDSEKDGSNSGDALERPGETAGEEVDLQLWVLEGQAEEEDFESSMAFASGAIADLPLDAQIALLADKAQPWLARLEIAATLYPSREDRAIDALIAILKDPGEETWIRTDVAGNCGAERILRAVEPLMEIVADREED